MLAAHLVVAIVMFQNFPTSAIIIIKSGGKWLEVKINAPELLRKERTKVFGSAIFFSSATDPYQYAELKYRLSRKCLEQLLLYKPQKVTLHTRSHLILQDIELLKKFGKRLNVGVSITTDNEEIRQKFEPKAPSISRRIEILKLLSSNGIKTYASIAPLLPSNPERLVELISPYTDKIWIEGMHYREVNTRKDLLQEYSYFFEPQAYKTAQSEISSYFKAAIERKKALSNSSSLRIVEPNQRELDILIAPLARYPKMKLPMKEESQLSISFSNL